MRSTARGALLALAAAILFGLVSVAARESALPPLVKGGYAYLLAGLLLAPALRGVRVHRADWPKVLAVGIVGGGLAPAFLFYGLATTTAVDASLLLTLELVFTAVFAAWFLRERPDRRAWAGVGLLFASALLLAAATGAREGSTSMMGAALVGLAALGWGADNTLSARLVGTYAPHQLLALKGLLGGGAALATALLLGQPMRVPAHEVANVLYIGLLGVGLSVLLFYHALRHVGATLTTSLFLPLAAFSGVIGGWALLDEPVGLAHLASGALALVGALVVTRAKRPVRSSS